MQNARIAAFAFAALAFATPAAATDAPGRGGDWTPQSRADLIELVECHAFTTLRLRESSAQFDSAGAWSFAHQTLMVEASRHDLVAQELWRLVDRDAYHALLDAHFPEGVAPGDSAERVDRWSRCTRLYGAIANALRFGRRG